MSDWSVSWHHQALGIPAIWGAGNFGAGVTVAVLDTGLVVAPGLDRNDFQRLDARGQEIAATDLTGHGTCCSSVIASYLGGALGIAPHARIVSLQVLETGTSTDDVVSALTYVLNRPDIDVVSCSFVMAGSSSSIANIQQAVRMLAEAGKVVVAAAGDDDSLTSYFPEQTPNALTVAATDESNNPISGARRGPWIDVSAQGRNLPAVTSDGTIGLFSESSAAAAVTSGVVALALAALAPADRRRVGRAIEGLLRATAIPLPNAEPAAVGRGLIDPAALIAAALAI